MKTITLTNSFHGTTVRIDARWQADPVRGQGVVWTDICYAASNGDQAAQRVLRRVRRALCGMSDCYCGTVLS